MRDRSQTIAALRRLAERPGTPAEGETARRLLEAMGGISWVPHPFDPAMFPAGTRTFYCYWCYRNTPVEGSEEETLYRRNIDWVQMQRDFLKRLRPFLTRENIEKLRGDFSDEVLNEALRFLRPHERLTND